MTKFLVMSGLAAGALLYASGAAAQPVGSTVTVTLEGVQSAAGQVGAALCSDPKAPFPGRCNAHAAIAAASAGRTVVTIRNVPPGTYALQAFHDANGDGIPQIPPEGYAYGNDAPWPPSFAAAAITVSGDTQVHARMAYLNMPTGQRPLGSKGAAAPAGVQKIDVRDNGLYAELYLPQGRKGPLPAIVLMSGSDGGLDWSSQVAGAFAARGYAALALAYWAEEGLPQTLEMIPLEYFDQAVAWLKARPEVAGRPVGALGWSRGSEAALLLASRNSGVGAVAAVAPSGLVWQGLNFRDAAHARPAWTAGGQPLPSLIPDASAYRPNAPLMAVFTSRLAEADQRPETIIPVERIGGPVLLISGRADALWPSAEMADQVVGRLKAARFPHPVEHLSYEDAGHLVFVGPPDGPTALASGTPSPMMGGTADGDRKAWLDDWPRTVAFFDKALKGGSR